MPTITVPATATNYTIYSRLKLVRVTETPNFVTSCDVQNEQNATSDDLKIGDSSMTSSDYDSLIPAGESVNYNSVTLSQKYVRNDGTNTINVHLGYSPM